MKNLWKGFVIGGVAGATIGLIVDAGSKASHRIVEVASDADLRTKAAGLRDRAADSEVVHKATERAGDLARAGTDVLHQARDAVEDRTLNSPPS